MLKDPPNHITENMIGYAHTPREIHEEIYILIYPEDLITLVHIQHSSKQITAIDTVSNYPPFAWRLLEYVYVPPFSARL